MKQSNNKALKSCKVLLVIWGILTLLTLIIAAITSIPILFTIFRYSAVTYLWAAMLYVICKYILEEKNKKM